MIFPPGMLRLGKGFKGYLIAEDVSVAFNISFDTTISLVKSSTVDVSRAQRDFRHLTLHS